MTTQTSLTHLTRPDGRTVTWSECGSARGVPVLWCHGSPASRLDAAPDGPFAGGYAAAGIRVVGWDRPGYGGSTPHPGRSLTDVADDAGAVADALGLGTFAMAGYSGGGPVALATAHRLGDRVTAVGVLACIAPPGLADHADLAEHELFDLAGADPVALRATLAQLAAGLRADTVATVRQLLAAGLTAEDLEVAADPSFAAMLMATLAESASQDLVGYAEDIDCLRSDWTPALRGVRQRVHLLHGTADRLVPVGHGRAVAAALPRAELIEVEGGHLSVLTHLPALIAAMLST
jgi:pimeloyl-ACP methyl ester carboxylesterase